MKPFIRIACGLKSVRREGNQRNSSQHKPLRSYLDIGLFISLVEKVSAKKLKAGAPPAKALLLRLIAEKNSLVDLVPLENSLFKITSPDLIREHGFGLIGESALAPQYKEFRVGKSLVMLRECAQVEHRDMSNVNSDIGAAALHLRDQGPTLQMAFERVVWCQPFGDQQGR